MVNYKRVVCEVAVLLALLAVAIAAPTHDCTEHETHYDQRQNGTENYRLNIDGVVIAVAPAESIIEAAAEFGDLFDISDIDDFLKPPSPPSSGSTTKPEKLPVDSLLSLLLKNSKRSGDEPIAQDRADVQPLTAFVEPNTPYRVIIGSEGERPVEADGGNAIVIAGRRRLEADSDPQEEMKLIGATEQCGPERRRDPVTLICKSINDLRAVKPENTPEVIPVPT
ncbi:jg1765 [Pararge aegeria aegeria]|uniref:Jg1765 protein n=1 Tax=Pararge aegeria aegeria TaxID=348720 RepID=A0A8S4RRG9_9NEOP|nr:jg1765 [Pararge aegeria aegeria]